jgi:hypothetical protein
MVASTANRASNKQNMKEGRDAGATGRSKGSDEDGYDFARRPWTKEVQDPPPHSFMWQNVCITSQTCTWRGLRCASLAPSAASWDASYFFDAHRYLVKILALRSFCESYMKRATPSLTATHASSRPF